GPPPAASRPGRPPGRRKRSRSGRWAFTSTRSTLAGRRAVVGRHFAMAENTLLRPSVAWHAEWFHNSGIPDRITTIQRARQCIHRAKHVTRLEEPPLSILVSLVHDADGRQGDEVKQKRNKERSVDQTLTNRRDVPV